ncbi:MAG: hypothetical protein GYB53_22735 [Rhodobacteraceae bacterium]|nr:hypothetical protein [Paracoccaceae bacterium]MBR9822940.1 hypothetical protein [Paracoccaceae bacterium]
MERLKAILLLCAAIAFALSPVLSPGFSGFTGDQFPVPQPDPPIQPMGLTFAVIWTVIYAWLIAMAGYGLLRRADDAAWDRPRAPLLLSLVIGAAWIPVANLSPLWATGMIWVMWATALHALLRAPARDRLWLQAPLGLYAGWLTAAAPVGTAVVATGYGATPEIWVHAAFLLLASWIAYAVARFSARPVPFYLGAVVWAVLGIVIDNVTVGRWIFAGLAGVVLLVLLPVFGQHIRRFARG